MSARVPKVSIVLVTWNSLKYLPDCFQSLEVQSHGRLEAIVVDNGSTDGSIEWLRRHHPAVRVLENRENLGFCAANNRAIGASDGEFVLLLNTDVVLDRRYIEILVEELEKDPGAGSASGKLLRGPPRTDGAPLLDSAGEVFYRTLRMVNRGEGEVDVGQYDRRQEVFGVSASAALYRRSALDDASFDGEYFDSSYFSYLEDSDLNWRARLRGWRSIYQPAAVAYHDRQHATSRPVAIRRHAHANRYLSIIKNASFLDLLLALPDVLVYEAFRGWKVLLRERDLLPAYVKVVRQLPELLSKRRRVRSTRRISAAELRRWMHREDYRRELATRLGLRRKDPSRHEAGAVDFRGSPGRPR